MKQNKIVAVLIIICMLFTSIIIMGAGNKEERKIVIFKKGISQAEKETVLKKYGATKIRDLKLVNGQSVIGPYGIAKKLANEEFVVHVENDIVLKALDKPDKTGKPPKEDNNTQPDQETPWGIERIHSQLAWEKTTGNNIKIAVVDTGIDIDHPDLVDNLKGGATFVSRSKGYDDDNGHGTHVAGTIGAVNNTLGVVGVAPNINLYAVKVLNRRGSGYLSDIIAGLDWCLANDINVINMSLGTNIYSSTFHEAVQTVEEAGIIMVAAAGNDYNGSVSYPAAFKETIAVSATKGNNELAYFSNIGPEIDVSAPGTNIYSTYKGSSYESLNGTSMATPHVTGVVALIIDYNGITTLEEIRSKFEETCIDLGTTGKDNSFGYGLVNVNADLFPEK